MSPSGLIADGTGLRRRRHGGWPKAEWHRLRKKIEVFFRCSGKRPAKGQGSRLFGPDFCWTPTYQGPIRSGSGHASDQSQAPGRCGSTGPFLLLSWFRN